MSNTLIIRNITPNDWQMIAQIAPYMHQSRLFGVSSPEQAMAIMLKGFELGLGLAASFEFIQVIQGRPTLSPRGALALIHQSGQLEGIKVTDEKDACTVWMKRKNGFEYQLRYSVEDATKAGLIKKDSGWDKYQANMLRWRAIGFCADVVFPDVIGGMKRADEFGAAITPDGDVIEGSWSVSSTTPSLSLKNEISLDQLIAQYGAEKVMVKNNGVVPDMNDLSLLKQIKEQLEQEKEEKENDNT